MKPLMDLHDRINYLIHLGSNSTLETGKLDDGTIYASLDLSYQGNGDFQCNSVFYQEGLHVEEAIKKLMNEISVYLLENDL